MVQIYSYNQFHENPSRGSPVFPCGQTDKQTDMTTLLVAFRNSANALKIQPQREKLTPEINWRKGVCYIQLWRRPVWQKFTDVSGGSCCHHNQGRSVHLYNTTISETLFWEQAILILRS